MTFATSVCITLCILCIIGLFYALPRMCWDHYVKGYKEGKEEAYRNANYVINKYFNVSPNENHPDRNDKAKVVRLDDYRK